MSPAAEATAFRQHPKFQKPSASFESRVQRFPVRTTTGPASTAYQHDLSAPGGRSEAAWSVFKSKAPQRQEKKRGGALDTPAPGHVDVKVGFAQHAAVDTRRGRPSTSFSSRQPRLQYKPSDTPAPGHYAENLEAAHSSVSRGRNAGPPAHGATHVFRSRSPRALTATDLLGSGPAATAYVTEHGTIAHRSRSAGAGGPSHHFRSTVERFKPKPPAHFSEVTAEKSLALDLAKMRAGRAVFSSVSPRLTERTNDVPGPGHYSSEGAGTIGAAAAASAAPQAAFQSRSPRAPGHQIRSYTPGPGSYRLPGDSSLTGAPARVVDPSSSDTRTNNTSSEVQGSAVFRSKCAREVYKSRPVPGPGHYHRPDVAPPGHGSPRAGRVTGVPFGRLQGERFKEVNHDTPGPGHHLPDQYSTFLR